MFIEACVHGKVCSIDTNPLSTDICICICVQDSVAAYMLAQGLQPIYPPFKTLIFDVISSTHIEQESERVKVLHVLHALGGMTFDIARSSDSFTPLHVALHLRMYEVARYLISSGGADINAVAGEEDLMPLHIVDRRKDEESVCMAQVNPRFLCIVNMHLQTHFNITL
jgi:hypothetical protein